jgi:hypothetical protein
LVPTVVARLGGELWATTIAAMVIAVDHVVPVVIASVRTPLGSDLRAEQCAVRIVTVGQSVEVVIAPVSAERRVLFFTLIRVTEEAGTTDARKDEQSEDDIAHSRERHPGDRCATRRAAFAPGT